MPLRFATEGEVGSGYDAAHFEAIDQQTGKFVGIHVGKFVGKFEADYLANAGFVQQAQSFRPG